MNYTLKLVDIKDSKVDNELRALYQEAFGFTYLPPVGFLYKNTNIKSELPTYFIVSEDRGKYVGSSAFILFDFSVNNEKLIGYQIGWSATLPSHQGQRIFINTINFAKKFLKEQGVSFLFATSNHTSQPIFEKKLGFRVVHNGVLKIPNVRYLKKMFFANPD